MKMEEIISITTGTPQFRIKDSSNKAPTYYFYGQQELENDLVGLELSPESARTISTMDDLSLVNEGDILFSLISGRATIVSEKHRGYLYTQNYVRMIPKDSIDSKYLVYILNENDFIKKQLIKGLQGSTTLKYTVKQLRELELPKLHSYDKQKIIGNIYFKQLRLRALKIRIADAERLLALKILKGVKL